MTMSTDVTTTVTKPVAVDLILKAGFGQDPQGRWFGPDKRWTWDTQEALTWALVALAGQE